MALKVEVAVIDAPSAPWSDRTWTVVDFRASPALAAAIEEGEGQLILLPASSDGGPCIGAVRLFDPFGKASRTSRHFRQYNDCVARAIRSKYIDMVTAGTERAESDGSVWVAGTSRGSVLAGTTSPGIFRCKTKTRATERVHKYAFLTEAPGPFGPAAVQYLHTLTPEGSPAHVRKSINQINSNRRRLAREAAAFHRLSSGAKQGVSVDSDQVESAKQAEALKSFHDDFQGITFHHCPICCECRPCWNTSETRVTHVRAGERRGRKRKREKDCTSCQRDPVLLSEQNCMVPSKPPDVLSALNFVEQVLVARVHPLLRILRWRGHGQRLLASPVTNIRQDVGEITRTLPLLPKDLPVLMIKGGPGQQAGAWVCTTRILSALHWLKVHNPMYSDIVISEDNLAEYLDPGVVHKLPSVSVSTVPTSQASCVSLDAVHTHFMDAGSRTGSGPPFSTEFHEYFEKYHLAVVDVGGGGDCFFLCMAAIRNGNLDPSGIQAMHVREDCHRWLQKITGQELESAQAAFHATVNGMSWEEYLDSRCTPGTFNEAPDLLALFSIPEYRVCMYGKGIWTDKLSPSSPLLVGDSPQLLVGAHGIVGLLHHGEHWQLVVDKSFSPSVSGVELLMTVERDEEQGAASESPTATTPQHSWQGSESRTLPADTKQNPSQIRRRRSRARGQLPVRSTPTSTIISGTAAAQEANLYHVAKIAARAANMQEVPACFAAQQWPAMEINKPVPDASKSSTPGLLSMAFPTLFPDGLGDFTRPICQKNVTMKAGLKHLLWVCFSGAEGKKSWPFQEHKSFLLWSFDTLRRQRSLASARYVVKSAFGDDASEPLHESTLKEHILKHKASLLAHVRRVRTQVPGSAEHMASERKQLEALVEQQGLPTIFFTLSAADLRWPTFLKHLGSSIQDSIANRAAAVERAPMVADCLFQMRVDAFVHRCLYGALNAKWHWLRYEWQSRGAPHVHGVAALHGAPDLHHHSQVRLLGILAGVELAGEGLTEERKATLGQLVSSGEESERVIAQYADTIITTTHARTTVPPEYHPCEHLPAVDTDHDIRLLAQVVQRHDPQHGPTCLRKTPSGEEVCRFGFPQPNVDKTYTRFVRVAAQVSPGSDDADDDAHLVHTPLFKTQLQTKRDHPFMNGYNKTMLASWRANIDVKLVLDMPAMITYLAKYGCKPEVPSLSFSELLPKVLAAPNRVRTLTSTADMPDQARRAALVGTISSLLMRMSSPRDVSIQEASHHLRGAKIVYSTFGFENVGITNRGGLIGGTEEVPQPARQSTIAEEGQAVAVTGLQAYAKRMKWVSECESSIELLTRIRDATLLEFFKDHAFGPMKRHSSLRTRNQGRTVGDVLYRRWKGGQGVPLTLLQDHVARSPILSETFFSKPVLPVFRPSIIASQGSSLYADYCKNQLKKYKCWHEGAFFEEAVGRPELDMPLQGSDQDRAEACIESWEAFIAAHPEIPALSQSDTRLQQQRLITSHGLAEACWAEHSLLSGSDPPKLQPLEDSDYVGDAFAAAFQDSTVSDTLSTIEELLHAGSCAAEVEAIAQELLVDSVVERNSLNGWLQLQKDDMASHPEWRLQQENVSFEQLNLGQKCVIRYLDFCCESGTQCLMLLHGTAGTGKSFTINAISSRWQSEVLRVAPSGVAAINISGKTIHSAFEIPVQLSWHEDMPVLDSLAAERLKASMSSEGTAPSILIVDEISMVSTSLFGRLEARCRQLFQVDKPFGGLHVVLVGDFGQIPPVAAASLLSSTTRGTTPSRQSGMSRIQHEHGLGLFTSLFSVKFELAKIERQQAHDQSEWRDALLAIREKKATQRHVDLIKSRSPSVLTLPPAVERQFSRCMHLFSTNRQVVAYSLSIWASFSDKMVISAHHPFGGKAATQASASDAGLMHPLPVAVDMPVHLTRNLWVEAGLGNGSRGILKAVILKNQAITSNVSLITSKHVVAALVQMDPPYSGPSVLEGIPRVIPVPVVSSSFTVQESGRTVKCTRSQLALKPDVARTVHKAQGLTLDRCVVDLRDAVPTHGLAFVALSRTRRLDDMIILPHNAERYKAEYPTTSVWPKRLQDFLAELKVSSSAFLDMCRRKGLV